MSEMDGFTCVQDDGMVGAAMSFNRSFEKWLALRGMIPMGHD